MSESAEISSEQGAQVVVAEHRENDDGHCAACLLDGVRIHVPCYARIEAHRYLDRLGLMP